MAPNLSTSAVSADEGLPATYMKMIGAPGDEITPRMIEAGVQVLWASGITDAPLGADRLLVVEIYQAMCSAREEAEAAPSPQSRTCEGFGR